MLARGLSTSKSAPTVRLGEILLRIGQLQKDCKELTDAFKDNALKQEREESNIAQDVLEEYWVKQNVMHRLRCQAQAANATHSFDDRQTMLDALLERKGLDEQIKAMNEMLKACRRQDHYYVAAPAGERPAVDIRAMRKTLGDLKTRTQLLEAQLSVRNWQIELEPVAP